MESKMAEAPSKQAKEISSRKSSSCFLVSSLSVSRSEGEEGEKKEEEEEEEEEVMEKGRLFFKGVVGVLGFLGLWVVEGK